MPLTLSNAIYIVIVTLLPWIELRGAIPIGVLCFKMSALTVFAISFITNIILIIPLFLILSIVFPLLCKIKLFDFYLSKLRKKSKHLVEKYGFFGLLVFVAVPLPGTGAYSGALAAFLLGFSKRKAFLAISLGVLIAGLIILAVSAFFNPFVDCSAIQSLLPQLNF